ncbi:hypothetical protein Tam10B_1140 [Bifidobacterium vansinderenii]|uniref:Single-stranded DNA-binding protein n=2 Tax=Bifidobacterium vansinderenii TaxID=1984871 RepID=A0A229VYE2_9BIFI|nr:hypothetical protein Tam10B_1140 [Bifidobacterium vansinderenii]
MVEGNLARDPRFWESDGRRPAFLSFTVMHTARIRDESGSWVDGRTTSVDVTFNGPAAERLHDRMEAAPGVLVKGAAVVAFGDVADVPNAWVGADGEAGASLRLLGYRVVPDQFVNQARRDRRDASDAPAGVGGRGRAAAAAAQRVETVTVDADDDGDGFDPWVDD